jgi:hypothetical protein
MIKTREWIGGDQSTLGFNCDYDLLLLPDGQLKHQRIEVTVFG